MSFVDGEPVEWARRALAAEGAVMRGAPVPVSVNVWSSVWTVATDAGGFWLKAGRPGDGGVEAVLARLLPDLVVAPVAVEPARGWLLTRDAGSTMEAEFSAGTEFDVERVCRLVGDYAALQRGTLGHTGALRAVGVAVADPACSAETARACADELAGFAKTDSRHLALADHERVLSAVPDLVAAGAALAAGPVPLALDHGDLATRNVFAPRAGGRHRFFDFSDARWGHPFESMVMLVWECVRRWSVVQAADTVDLRDARIRAVLDSYLSCWSDFADIGVLRGLAREALRLAPLHRCGVWLALLADADGGSVARHGRTPWAWLQDVTKPVLL